VSAPHDEGGEGPRPVRHPQGTLLTVVAVVLCTLAVALAYGNSLRNEFALDDAHTTSNA
jgi:hypothetical protein